MEANQLALNRNTNASSLSCVAKFCGMLKMANPSMPAFQPSAKRSISYKIGEAVRDRRWKYLSRFSGADEGVDRTTGDYMNAQPHQRAGDHDCSKAESLSALQSAIPMEAGEPSSSVAQHATSNAAALLSSRAAPATPLFNRHHCRFALADRG